YFVSEEGESGWTQTFGEDGHIITATSGDDDTDNDFANFENIDISGYKFADLNGNGAWDEGELGLSGWTIYLDTDTDSTNGGIVATALTDAEGKYQFLNLGPDTLNSGTTYYIYEQQQNGWTQTFDGSASFAIESGVDLSGAFGLAEDFNFGNQLIEGPGVRTPGFWQNPTNGGTFWDGIIGNEAHSGPTFPDGELLGYNDADGDGPGTTLIANPYILLGDDDGDGQITAADTGPFLTISLTDALKFIGSNGAPKGDMSWNLARDAIATQLNFLAGNPSGDPSDPTSPEAYLDQAILWLSTYDKNDDGTLTIGELGSHKASSKEWQKGIDTDGNVSNGYEILAGATIHTALDQYNNDGSIDSTFFAFDGDFASDQQLQYMNMLQAASI
ncbi:MAG: SdrD B-like domain-containing protein, partial [Beijerinckiaceae bacterium]|nr:SdrD B-like domain-containing protein [Beijerinckiaceae bacterium]